MPQNLTDEMSTLVQVMAWCCQATSHHLSQCWPRTMAPYRVTRPQRVMSIFQSNFNQNYENSISENVFKICCLQKLLRANQIDCLHKQRCLLGPCFVQSPVSHSLWATSWLKYLKILFAFRSISFAFHSIFILRAQSGHTNWHVLLQLSCCGLCKIMTLSDHVSAADIFQDFSLWACLPLVKQAPGCIIFLELFFIRLVTKISQLNNTTLHSPN